MQKTIKRWKKSFPESISIMEFNEIGNGVSIIKKVQNKVDEPVFTALKFMEGWIRALRNYVRLKTMNVHD